MTFQQFQTLWAEPFNRIPGVLAYICTFPEIAESLGRISPLTLEELEERQTQWLDMLEKQTYEAERDFFKPHWVPIGDSYFEPFIDVAVPEMPIITHYFRTFKMGFYMKTTLVEDVHQFIIELESSEDVFLREINVKIEEKWDVSPDSFRKAANMANVKEHLPFTYDSIAKREEDAGYFLEPYGVRFYSVSKMVVRLFSEELEVTIDPENQTWVLGEEILAEVTNICSLYYLLCWSGRLNIHAFTASVHISSPCIIEFSENEFRVKCDDKKIINQLCEKFDRLKARRKEILGETDLSWFESPKTNFTMKDKSELRPSKLNLNVLTSEIANRVNSIKEIEAWLLKNVELYREIYLYVHSLYLFEMEDGTVVRLPDTMKRTVDDIFINLFEQLVQALKYQRFEKYCEQEIRAFHEIKNSKSEVKTWLSRNKDVRTKDLFLLPIDQLNEPTDDYHVWLYSNTEFNIYIARSDFKSCLEFLDICCELEDDDG